MEVTKRPERVTPVRLGQWRQAAERAFDSVSLAMHAIMRHQDIGGKTALQHLADAHAEAGRVLIGLDRVSSGAGSELGHDALDLRRLRSLDSPAARRLLVLLTEAQAVAEDVDRERGRCLSDDLPVQDGETRGTDLAETISELRFRLKYEVEGPTGRD